MEGSLARGRDSERGLLGGKVFAVRRDGAAHTGQALLESRLLVKPIYLRKNGTAFLFSREIDPYFFGKVGGDIWLIWPNFVLGPPGIVPDLSYPDSTFRFAQRFASDPPLQIWTKRTE